MNLQMTHTSASQDKTHRLCPRKHYLEKVEGRRSPTGKAAQLGKDVHKHVEDYLRKGRPIPDTHSGRIAMALLPMIDRASEPEVNFELPFIEGLTIKGQIDLVRRAENTIEDIKTTSDILKYGKTKKNWRWMSNAWCTCGLHGYIPTCPNRIHSHTYMSRHEVSIRPIA